MHYMSKVCDHMQPHRTSVEVVTFNMGGNKMALADVLIAVGKEADLIVIGIQEAEDINWSYKTKMDQFFEQYKCEFHSSLFAPINKTILIFIYVKNTQSPQSPKLRFKSDCIRFHVHDLRDWRLGKGAIIVNCTLPNFEPYYFIVSHFHAGESTERNIKQRIHDLGQIKEHIHNEEDISGWCLFGDLNVRKNKNSSNKNSSDAEFENLKTKYSIFETNPLTHIDNTYKLIPKSRSKFDSKRIPSRTDRIVHNKSQHDNDQPHNIYAVVERAGIEHEAAGAGSDHKAVFEVFHIDWRSCIP